MTFTVRIDCDNSAFEGDQLTQEIARILRGIVNQVATYPVGQSQTLRDVNGNDVGRAKISR